MVCVYEFYAHVLAYGDDDSDDSDDDENHKHFLNFDRHEHRCYNNMLLQVLYHIRKYMKYKKMCITINKLKKPIKILLFS